MEATKSIRSDGNCLSGPDTRPSPSPSPLLPRAAAASIVSARRIPDVKKKEGPLFLPANKRGTRNNERETSGGIDKLGGNKWNKFVGERRGTVDSPFVSFSRKKKEEKERKR